MTLLNLNPNFTSDFSISLRSIASAFKTDYNEGNLKDFIMPINSFYFKVSIDKSKSLYDPHRYVFSTNLPDYDQFYANSEVSTDPILILYGDRTKNNLNQILLYAKALQDFFKNGFYTNSQTIDNPIYKKYFLKDLEDILHADHFRNNEHYPLNTDYQRDELKFEPFWSYLYSPKIANYWRQSFEQRVQYDKKKELEKPIHLRSPLYVEQNIIFAYLQNCIQVANSIFKAKDSRQKDLNDFFGNEFLKEVFNEGFKKIKRESIFYAMYEDNNYKLRDEYLLTQNQNFINRTNRTYNMSYTSNTLGNIQHPSNDLAYEINKNQFQTNKINNQNKIINKDNDLIKKADAEIVKNYLPSLKNHLKINDYDWNKMWDNNYLNTQEINNTSQPVYQQYRKILTPEDLRILNANAIPHTATKQTLKDAYINEDDFKQTINNLKHNNWNNLVPMEIPTAFLNEDLMYFVRLFSKSFNATNYQYHTIWNDNNFLLNLDIHKTQKITNTNDVITNPSVIPYLSLIHPSNVYNGFNNVLMLNDAFKDAYKKELTANYKQELAKKTNNGDVVAKQELDDLNTKEVYNTYLDLIKKEQELMHYNFKDLLDYFEKDKEELDLSFNETQLFSNSYLRNFYNFLKIRDMYNLYPKTINDFFKDEGIKDDESLLEFYNDNITQPNLNTQENQLFKILNLPFISNISLVYDGLKTNKNNDDDFNDFNDLYLGQTDLKKLTDLFNLPFKDFINQLNNDPVSLMEFVRLFENNSYLNSALINKMLNNYKLNEDKIKKSIIYRFNELPNDQKNNFILYWKHRWLKNKLESPNDVNINDLLQSYLDTLEDYYGTRNIFLYLKNNTLNYYLNKDDETYQNVLNNSINEIGALKNFKENYGKDTLLTLNEFETWTNDTKHSTIARNLQNELLNKINIDSLWEIDEQDTLKRERSTPEGRIFMRGK